MILCRLSHKELSILIYLWHSVAIHRWASRIIVRIRLFAIRYNFIIKATCLHHHHAVRRQLWLRMSRIVHHKRYATIQIVMCILHQNDFVLNYAVQFVAICLQIQLSQRLVRLYSNKIWTNRRLFANIIFIDTICECFVVRHLYIFYRNVFIDFVLHASYQKSIMV